MSVRKILVIGGVAAGASFAARARRHDESAQITIVERGPDVSFANCGLPYHIGGDIAKREVLAVQTPASLKALLNLDVITLCEAVRIERAEKRVEVRYLSSGKSEWLSYDTLMIAPGAAPIRPPLPGIDDARIFTLRNLVDMDRIVSASTAGMRAVVVGAGFIGLEMAEQLKHKGLSVSLIEMQPQVLPQVDAPMTRLLEGELRRNGVAVHLGQQLTHFAAGESGLACHMASGEVLVADIVIMSIGVRPESKLAGEAGLVLGERGHIVVSEFMQTSDPSIYAAGDAVETEDRTLGGKTVVALGGPANRQGRVAADHVFMPQQARAYPGSLGTAIVRAFEVVAGVTGWTESRLQKAGKTYGTVTVNDYHHASYYPGACALTLKILWDAESGRLLGAQATGHEGVDKRIDVLATAISARMTVDELCHLELSYAPPFGSAKDVVNLAGFAATNLRDGLFSSTDRLPDDDIVQVIDVRGQALAEAHPLPGALRIPVARLRQSLDQLDRTRPVLTVCSFGKMSYFAARILAQHGFDVKSMSGGIKANIDPDMPSKI